MGHGKMEEVLAQVKEWDFLQQLPGTIADFSLGLGPFTVADKAFTMASYSNKERHARVFLIYSGETGDYILVQQMGLNMYRDVRFIFRDRERFAAKVRVALPAIIELMVEPEKRRLGEMVEAKRIREWEYGNALPDSIGPFVRYIRPAESIEHINGSIILLDYTDFARQDQLVIYYNRLRDEFFGETKVGGIFHYTDDFDAVNLAELEGKLRQNLRSTLEKLTQAEQSL